MKRTTLQKTCLPLVLTLASAIAGQVHAEAAMDHSAHGAHQGHAAPVVAPSAMPLREPKTAPDPTPAMEAMLATPDSGTPTGGENSEHTGHEGGGDFWWLRLDRLEAADNGDETTANWKGGLSWGGSFNRLWLTSEGERAEGESSDTETQLYWSHAVAPFWDATAGVRRDNGPGDSRSWLALGVRGLAPYWFESAATAYLGEGGQTALRLEADYEILFTNRLILQPDVEVEFFGKEEAASLEGQGLAESRIGLRLRYEVSRKFAPYVGVEWGRRHGRTEDLVGSAGERVHDTQVLAGLRLWY